jgi:hypothetical protein
MDENVTQTIIYNNSRPDKKNASPVIKIEFQTKDGLLRYSKALKYLFVKQKIINTEFNENITIENKF